MSTLATSATLVDLAAALAILAGSPALSRPPAAGPESTAVTLASRLRLHVLTQGPKTGPAVVMLHGYTDSSFSFSRVLPLLPDSLRVIVPDQRGHGDSDRPPRGYSMDDMAADVVALLDALDVPRAVLVGHSMGSFVARRAVATAGDRVAGLVLIGTGATFHTPDLLEFRKTIDALSDPVDPAFVREFQLSTVARPVPAAFMDRAIAESLKVPARVWKAAGAGQFAYAGPAPPFAGPSIVLGGDRDAIFAVPNQQAAAREIEGAVLDIVPGSGHALHWEDPDRAAAAIVRLSRQAFGGS
jgi:pimeloyl-ACP methyl ester carboxylesterase